MSKKNSKESETQPYRIFKEFLDKIVKIPEENMKKLYALFEERRLQAKDVSEAKEEPVSEEHVSEAPVSEEPVSEAPVSESKGFFDNFFSGEQGNQLFESVSEKIDESNKTGLTSANAPQHKCLIREW
jgi:hypothetical protein